MSALKSDTRIVLSFCGRSNFGIDQWAYVPFDVPEGTQRIDVSTSHDQFSLLGMGRNVLDLGIFGPAGHELGNTEGFRGWSGGARAGFMLSAVNATPGYLAGPIEPGRAAADRRVRARPVHARARRGPSPRSVLCGRIERGDFGSQCISRQRYGLGASRRDAARAGGRRAHAAVVGDQGDTRVGRAAHLNGRGHPSA
jgi:hypothetical protein